MVLREVRTIILILLLFPHFLPPVSSGFSSSLSASPFNSTDVWNLTKEAISREYIHYLEFYHKPLTRINDTQRLETFTRNMQRIQQFNHDRSVRYSSGGSPFKLSLNEFSDMHDEEVKALFHEYPEKDQSIRRAPSASPSQRGGGGVQGGQWWRQSLGDAVEGSNSWTDFFHRFFPSLSAEEQVSSDVGHTLNWAGKENPYQQPVTGDIHFQGTCGACWAFVAAAAAEAAIKISLLQSGSEADKRRAARGVPDLSAQELIDCDKQYNRGCNGGNPLIAFNYIAENGLSSWTAYPYEERVQRCQSSATSSHDSRYYITRVHKLVAHSEVVIREALKDGPVSVGVCGTDSPFLFYSSGIFDYPDCCDSQNHALLIVGYGHDDGLGLDYWLAQNSWGKQWGEDGFMRLLRRDSDAVTSGDSGGVCGLTLNPSQALGGYYVERDGSVIVGNGVSPYFLPFYRLFHYFESNWKPLAICTALSLMFCSFLFLAYGLYLDRLVQHDIELHASRYTGYQRINDREVDSSNGDSNQNKTRKSYNEDGLYYQQT